MEVMISNIKFLRVKPKTGGSSNMYKKIILALLAITMLISSVTVFGTGYDAFEGYTAASADPMPNNKTTAEQHGNILNSDVIGSQRQLDVKNTENTENIEVKENSSKAEADTRRAASGVNSVNGVNLGEVNSNLGNAAEVDENNSKNNKMAAGPVSEAPAASRYSSVRISLAPDIAGTKYEEAAELLGALGIMVGDAEDGAFRPNDSIIRSEMAKVAVYSVGLEEMAKSSNGTTQFPDVPADHWATGAINTAHGQGMVVGDDVGTYRPDDPVLLQEAIAVMVRAMGYEPAAADKGGYPTGYLSVASSNQLLRGISGATSQAATRGDIAQLVFNCLTVNLMEQVSYGTSTKYEVVEKTLLYDKLNVEKGYGQLTGTGETSLTGGNTTAEDKVQIGDKLFTTGDSNAKQFLGYNVLYYARVDKTKDEKTIINIREQANKNKTVTVAAKDIVSATGEAKEERTIEYWENDSDRNTKTAKIGGDAVFIFNGKYKDNVSAAELKPISGNITLLDSDTNGIYEIVFVNHFTNIVVDTVSKVTGRVTDKYMNGSLVFDENDTDVIYSLILNGKEIGVSDLKEWNVISYTVSEDKKLVKGYVSDASVSGTVTEINDNKYRIGSESQRYEKAVNYPNDIKLRDKGTFYLDIEGKIAAVNENAVTGAENVGKKYGYLTAAIMDDGFENTAQFKIFTAGGETAVLKSAEKMRFNKEYAVKAKDVVDALNKSKTGIAQLINYETNSSGNIIAIDTATDGTSTGAPNKDSFTLNISNGNMIYKSASGKLGNVGIDDSTIIFDIPATAEGDTDKYSVRSKNTLSNDTSYAAKIYDLQENYVAKAVIITNSSKTTAEDSPATVVDYISETQNADYEDTDRLYAWQSGKNVDILAADKGVLVKGENGKAKALEAGDIIQYRTNADGEIDSVSVLFDVSAKNTEFVNDISNDLTCVYGKVTKKFSGSVNLSINNDIRNHATKDANVYLYDSTKTNNKIKVVSDSDIEVFEEGNEVRLFMRIYQDKVEDIVIVR